MITKKHLKELADIVHKASSTGRRGHRGESKDLPATRPQLFRVTLGKLHDKKDEEILKKAGWLQ